MELTHKEKVIRNQVYHQKLIILGHLKRANNANQRFKDSQNELCLQGVDVDRIRLSDVRFQQLESEIQEEIEKLQ